MATAKVAIAPMEAAQISKPGADFEVIEREIPRLRAHAERKRKVPSRSHDARPLVGDIHAL
jgi:hypothetical protein